jgi:hypothetical protein
LFSSGRVARQAIRVSLSTSAWPDQLDNFARTSSCGGGQPSTSTSHVRALVGCLLFILHRRRMSLSNGIGRKAGRGVFDRHGLRGAFQKHAHYHTACPSATTRSPAGNKSQEHSTPGGHQGSTQQANGKQQRPPADAQGATQWQHHTAKHRGEDTPVSAMIDPDVAKDTCVE